MNIIPAKIGILREGKVPPDRRTPLTPRQCRELMNKYPEVEVVVEWASFRCFDEEEYRQFGVEVKENIYDCDILLGIKEVPPQNLQEGKTYMFFSHTIKAQPYNRNLLQEVLRKKVTLIDYEVITDEHYKRLIGFGRWAGIVGAHYGLLMLGRRTGAYYLKPAAECVNLQEMTDQYHSIQIPPARFILTGGGRVAQGAIEIMHAAGIKEISPEEYLSDEFSEPVFTVLHSDKLYTRRDGAPTKKQHFYAHPEMYESAFGPYMERTDVLINCMFWDPHAPRLFQIEDINKDNFRMNTISDVSCDINGSVPLTIKDTYSEDPVYGYHAGGSLGKPYQADTIDVMAVSNLPNELPRDASRDFGKIMLENVLPKLLSEKEYAMFERATIASGGKLTPRFSYLQDFVDGKEE